MSVRSAVADAPSHFYLYYRVAADAVAVDGIRTVECFSALRPYPFPRSAPRK